MTAGFRLRDAEVTGYVVIVLTVQSLTRLLRAVEAWEASTALTMSPQTHRRSAGGRHAATGSTTMRPHGIVHDRRRADDPELEPVAGSTATGLSRQRRSSAGRCSRSVPSLLERGFDQYYADALAGQVKVLSHTLHRYIVPATRAGSAEQMPQSAGSLRSSTAIAIVGTITIVEDVTRAGGHRT